MILTIVIWVVIVAFTVWCLIQAAKDKREKEQEDAARRGEEEQRRRWEQRW